MDHKNKKITVRDVARVSGVSKGTVDRVLHDRGEVSHETRRKVLDAVRELGYSVNPYASLLASRRSYRIVCLVPRMRPGEYWELVYKGIERARERNSGYNILIESAGYDQFDASSFDEAVRRMTDSMPDAVVIAPMYREKTLRLASRLEDGGIPFVYIDSKLGQGNYTAYFGMPMYESGRLAASLVLSAGAPEEIANFRIERGSSPMDNPTLRRREGFLEYLAAHSPATHVHNEFIKPYDAGYNDRVLDSFFAEHPAVKHVVTFNSRVHLIADYLRERRMEGMRVVGFDMLPGNIQALREGRLSFLIAQRTETQVYSGINCLADFLLFRREPYIKDNYMSMDILTSENVEFYSDLEP